MHHICQNITAGIQAKPNSTLHSIDMPRTSNVTETSSDLEFISILRDELLQIKQHSFERTKQKTLLVTAILGIGSLNTSNSLILHFYSLLYLVPVVCFTYDILYLGDKYAARRIGSFMRQYGEDGMNKAWENFVAKPCIRGPSWLYWMGEVGITFTAILSALIILFHNLREQNSSTKEFLAPLALNISLLVVLYIINMLTKQRYKFLDNVTCLEN